MCTQNMRYLPGVIVAAEGATFHDLPHFPGGMCQVTESSPPGVIAPEQDERRHSC